MSCIVYPVDGTASVSAMLAGVDCATANATHFAFDHLFGNRGALGFALKAMLTLYVALLAMNLLTGRSSLRLSLLTPRALTVGLVLTFATSWVAYQQVVWNLAAGAPDQIAGILSGTHGSAVHLFTERLDRLFSAVADAAASAAANTADAARKAAPFTPADLLWFAAMLLLLGTAGVLIVARIALAAMLALGPLFIVLALFEASRGLFEGWLRGAVLFAVTPLLTVLVGSGALLLLNPMVEALALSGDAPSMQMAVGLFMGACVYVTLMVMALKAATVLTSALRLPRIAATPAAGHAPVMAVPAAAPISFHRSAAQDERIRRLVTATQSSSATVTSRLYAEAAPAGARLPQPPPSIGNRPSHHERLRGLGARNSRKELLS